AGLATLRELREKPPYAALETMSATIERELPKLCAERKIPHHFARVGSMWTLFFTGTPVVDYDTAKTSDAKKFGRFFWAMLERGVYLPCSQFEAAFTSAAMTPAHIDETLRAAREALDTLAI